MAAEELFRCLQFGGFFWIFAVWGAFWIFAVWRFYKRSFVGLDPVQQFFTWNWISDGLFAFHYPNGIEEGSRFRAVLGTVLLKIRKFFFFFLEDWMVGWSPIYNCEGCLELLEDNQSELKSFLFLVQNAPLSSPCRLSKALSLILTNRGIPLCPMDWRNFLIKPKQPHRASSNRNLLSCVKIDSLRNRSGRFVHHK